jgi:hypothetical protein
MNDKKIDEYTALLMAAFLLEHDYIDASDQIKYFVNMALIHNPKKVVRANIPPHNGN